MSHDWNQTRRLLVAGSVPAFKAFFAIHPLQTIRALGYTWEWGQPSAAFYCVANTQAGIEKAMQSVNRYRDPPLGPAEAPETIRWEAGYFHFPAGLTGPNDELGAEWGAEVTKLHVLLEVMRPADINNEEQYAQYARTYEAFLASLVTTCCEALAEIALGGHFGNFDTIDFWVGSTDDNGAVVLDRNARVGQMIADMRR
jgi:hypothetical protein